MIHNIKDILKLKNNIISNNIDIINNFILLNHYNNKFFINNNFIKSLLESYDDGIYGILNYSLSFNNNNIFINNNEFINYQIKNKITKNIEKLLNETKNKLTNEAFDQNYGLLELYKKENDEIINIQQIYILQNGSIKHLNDLDDNNLIDIEIITKIYHFDNNKIKHIRTIDREDIDDIDDIDNNNIKLLLDIINKRKDNLEYEYKINELINLTHYNDETKKYILCRDYDIELLEKLTNPVNQHIDYKDIMDIKLDFEILNPLINKNKEEYDKLWFINYGKDIKEIITIILDKYTFDNKIKSHITNVMEILLRYYLYINKKINNFSIEKRLYDLYLFKDKINANYSILRQLNKQLYKSKVNLYLEDPNTISTYILSLLKYMSLNKLLDIIENDKMIPYYKDIITINIENEKK